MICSHGASTPSSAQRVPLGASEVSPIQESLRVSNPGAQLTSTRPQQPPERRVNLGGGGFFFLLVCFVRKGKILSFTCAPGKLVPEQAFKSGFLLCFCFLFLNYCICVGRGTLMLWIACGGQRTTFNSHFSPPAIHMLQRLNSGH